MNNNNYYSRNKYPLNTVRKGQHDQWYDLAQRLFYEADIKINGSRPFDIQVHDNRFFKRVLQQGALGLGESYMDGWWDCEKLDEMVTRTLRADLDGIIKRNMKNMVRLAGEKLLNMQSNKWAWIGGTEHYDLGNRLFCLILDPYMQYSCGYWRNAENLHTAQQNKLKLICEKLQLKKGMTLLDIGCGWGGLAAYAAENYGVRVTGVTVSAEQIRMASIRCSSLDIDFKLIDYQDLPTLTQTFDRIVSIGMFEHVGAKNHLTYFNIINQLLKKSGLFLLHTICSNKTDHNVDPWINKYIFQHDSLSSISQISSASETWFVTEDLHNFGTDYDKTLIAWEQRFNSSWHLLEDDYPPIFRRTFDYYLNSCAGAVRARKIQLLQFIFTKGI
ncbi:cyclopropane-fatty-acyl-phospholipid synthase [Citrobacter europaeus]|uniref:cyclopropane fatty acyl phospholipid synthase n=1 Tax=Citrobacter europaeus TaxID=1914243 RepID=UPI000CD27BAD|nr:cyclopropane fatty acyl phospholipid synthase [Citrobacter europaeus]AUT97707.1 cyclopropane-fatty-acyl-phospholipid synthase [Citrobacter freundii]ROW38435.1 cyclopropane-fatty-acyl-phospholipid synthase [Citrobacter europaeus]